MTVKRCRDCDIILTGMRHVSAVLSGRCDYCQKNRDAYYEEKCKHEEQYSKPENEEKE